MVLDTEHASPERASWEELHKQITTLAKHRSFQSLARSVKEIVVLFNPQRQVVFASKKFLEMVRIEDPAEVMGCRLGEILGCVNASKGMGGCGTSRNCRRCGAINSILRAQTGVTDVQDCQIQRETAKPANLRIHSAPIHVLGTLYVLSSIEKLESGSVASPCTRVFLSEGKAET